MSDPPPPPDAAPPAKFAVLAGSAVWTAGPQAGLGKLCDEWIAQSERIEAAEKDKAEADRVYLAWADIRELRASLASALAPSGGALAGTEFNARFVKPALAILGSGKKLEVWAVKHNGVPQAQASKAGEILITAAKTVQGLAAAVTEAASIGVTPEDAEKYWEPLHAALGPPGDALANLCPRLMNVRNASIVCGLAKESAGQCLVLTENGAIRALAMRSISVTLQIHQITVEPQALYAKVKGLGSMLIEYLVREAAAKGIAVCLLPLGDMAQAFYESIGFKPPAAGGSDWVMDIPAQKAYLKTHRVFEAQFK